MGSSTIEETLKRTEVFLWLNDDDIELIASLPSSREASYQAGQALFKTGDEAKYIYLLEEGQIDMMVETSNHPSNPLTVDLITKGGFFGWSAIVRPHIYTLSAVCSQPSKVVMIRGSELMSLLEQNNQIGYKVLLGLTQIIGSRFRDLEHFLINGRRGPFIQKYSGA